MHGQLASPASLQECQAVSKPGAQIGQNFKPGPLPQHRPCKLKAGSKCIPVQAAMGSSLPAHQLAARSATQPVAVAFSEGRRSGLGPRSRLQSQTTFGQSARNASASRAAGQTLRLPRPCSRRARCCLTLRSTGPAPASRLGREAPWFILHFAAQAPSRRRPVSSNVRRRVRNRRWSSERTRRSR